MTSEAATEATIPPQGIEVPTEVDNNAHGKSQCTEGKYRIVNGG
jgi:hypothetical protein